MNLELTQQSGQTSQSPWKKVGDTYQDVVSVGGKPVLFKVDDKLNFDYELPVDVDFKVSKKEANDEFRRIFDLDFNLEKFYSYLRDDEKLAEIPDFCNGLRLFIAKDKFESIISSISSANNSIARWTKSMDQFKSKWGVNYHFPSGDFQGFPSADTLSACYEDEIEESDFSNIAIEECLNNLKSCGVGYRSKYIKGACDFFTNEVAVEDISKMSYEEAFEVIQKVPGVGPKVADCILLYGYNFKEAFPSDVWIKRIVSYLYFDQKDIPVPKVREFGMEKFGDYAGYVQLYLFHYARKSGLLKKLKNRS